MSPYRALQFSTVSLSCFVCVWLVGGPFVAEVKAAAPAKPARTDASGDPLPPGALLRLGTVRWRAFARRLVFTPDGKTLVTVEDAPSGSVVRFWEVATGKETSNFHLPGQLTAFALSPDGKTLVVDTGDEENAIRFLRVPDGKVLRRMEDLQSYEFEGLWFSPDGKWLAGAGDHGHFYVWNAANGKEVLSGSDGGGDDNFVSLTFSPDSKKLAIGRRDTVRLLEIATEKKLLELGRTQKEVGWAKIAGFSPDGKKLLWRGEDSHSFALRDASTGAPLLSFRVPKGTVRPVAFSPDGKRIASFDSSGDGPRMIGLWDAATGKELRQLTAPRTDDWVADPVFSPDGKLLACPGDADGLLHVWDVETNEDISQIGEHRSVVYSVAFSTNGRTALTGCADNIIRLWEAGKGTLARRIQVDGLRGDPNIDYVVLSKDRRAAALPSDHRAAAMWDLDLGKRRTELGGKTDVVRHPLFAPDGRTLASSGDHKGIQFWDITTGKKTKRIAAIDNSLVFAFSPDGKTLAVERESGRTQFSPGEIERTLWDLARGTEIRKWSFPNGQWNNLQFSPSGSMIAGAVEGGVDLWDAVTGKELPALLAPEAGSLNCLAFSQDGRTLAAAGDSGAIYLWDVGAAKVRAVLTGHRAKVMSLDFSPDGSRLISGSNDTTALIWDLTGVADEKGAKVLTPERLASLWEELSDADADKAWRAGWRLAADPAASVPFLQKHVRPAEVDAHQIAQLLTALDGDAFDERESATARLAKLGDLAEPAVRKALEAKPSPESRRRLEELVNKLDGPIAIPEQARDLRCVEVLEHIGSPEARRLLDELGKGTPGTRLTRDAKASLARLTKSASEPSRP